MWNSSTSVVVSIFHDMVVHVAQWKNGGIYSKGHIGHSCEDEMLVVNSDITKPC